VIVIVSSGVGVADAISAIAAPATHFSPAYDFRASLGWNPEAIAPTASIAADALSA
jgi:hypothetical protein